jgi:UDP-N-acetylglucosamine--N-acetylmuramyl-(pentapeptide) pyrophosphoryl-undecaprenol N-acetylglucosamine transferase
VAALRVIFAGGGTGGHLFPAVAIADAVKQRVPGAEILFIGTKGKIESRIIPSTPYAFRTIWISVFQRSLKPGNFLFPLKVLVAMFQARSILKSFRPDVVVGTGGYVSGPVLRTAVRLRIPTIIQEQNSYPGVTTRVLARSVDEVHLTFESSKKYFPRTDNLFVTGNPTRFTLGPADRAAASRFFGFDPSSPAKTLLVFGGSLGARSINRAVAALLPALSGSGVRVIWQTGAEDFDLYRRGAGNAAPASLWMGPFIDRMDLAYAASDLVVARAGATTIAELTQLGKPAILVPYPHAAANHQAENARALSAAGAAEVVADAEIESKLPGVVASLLADEQRRRAMGDRSRTLGRPEATATLADRVITLAQRRN